MAVISLQEMVNLRNSWYDIKIIWTNGCFDILHRGHIEFLKRCKEQGDFLIVGLNSDKSMEKIKRRPINRQEDRAAVLDSIKYVDYVVIFDDLEPSRIISLLKPDVAIKAGDWEGKKVPEKEVVEGYGGRFMFLPHKKGYSTTEIIKRCKNAR